MWFPSVLRASCSIEYPRGLAGRESSCFSRPWIAGAVAQLEAAVDSVGTIAIKVLRSDLAGARDRLRRFEQAAEAASALNHPNILTIHDIGHEAGVAFIVIEWVQGMTLRDLMAGGGLPPRRLAHIAHQIAEGPAQAHAAGIVHRDLKPENIMVSHTDAAKAQRFTESGIYGCGGLRRKDWPHRAIRRTQLSRLPGSLRLSLIRSER
jgi:serine/threonine protein kinase